MCIKILVIQCLKQVLIDFKPNVITNKIDYGYCILFPFSLQKLTTLILACLNKTAAENHSSIAFPPLGMGRRGYPDVVVAQAFVDAVKEHCRHWLTSSIILVKIYLYDKDISHMPVSMIATLHFE